MVVTGACCGAAAGVMTVTTLDEDGCGCYDVSVCGGYGCMLLSGAAYVATSAGMVVGG